MRALYVDCVCGISGDMFLSALVDAGADATWVEAELRKLPLDAFDMKFYPVQKKGIRALQLDLTIHSGKVAQDSLHHHHESEHHHHHESEHHHHHESEHHHHRTASTILGMIRSSQLPSRVKERALAVFDVIARAEAKIHGMPVEQVHFHEVGAMDSIIDIIGACLALESLGIDRVIASPVPTGSGKVRCQHGLYPVPAPATAEILIGIPIAPSPAASELTTPTGAGFLKALCEQFGPLGAFTIDRIGYGAGVKDFDVPNVLRVFVGQESSHPGSGKSGHDHPHESVWLLQTNIDDFPAEGLGYVMDALFQTGSLDVWFTPITMKKNRPAVLLSVLCHDDRVDACEDLLFRETSTLGVRRTKWERTALRRRTTRLHTQYGFVRMKIGELGDAVVNVAPEYEDVARCAMETGVAWKDVHQAAMAAYGAMDA